jgi:hypothetical protein
VKTVFSTTLCALIFLAVLGCAQNEQPGEEAGTSAERIGIYDSRALAVAFVGTQVSQDYLKDLMSRHEKAKAAGDTKLVAELEAEGKARQRLLHKQGFSTAPVDNILAHIKDLLPGIAKEAGVGPIVSKWDKETLSEYESAEQVDITMALVRALKPNEKQLKLAREIKKHKPVSLEEMERHMSEKDY